MLYTLDRHDTCLREKPLDYEHILDTGKKQKRRHTVHNIDDELHQIMAEHKRDDRKREQMRSQLKRQAKKSKEYHDQK